MPDRRAAPARRVCCGFHWDEQGFQFGDDTFPQTVSSPVLSYHHALGHRDVLDVC